MFFKGLLSRKIYECGKHERQRKAWAEFPGVLHLGRRNGLFLLSLKRASFQFTWVFVVSKDRKWHPGIRREKRIPDALTCAFYAPSGCSHWPTKLFLWTRSPKCLPQGNFVSSGAASQKEIFYICCELPFLRCCLKARSCLKDLYSVQFPIGKSSMVWKIRKRVSKSVSGMLSQKLCVQHYAGARNNLSVLKQPSQRQLYSIKPSGLQHSLYILKIYGCGHALNLYLHSNFRLPSSWEKTSDMFWFHWKYN